MAVATKKKSGADERVKSIYLPKSLRQRMKDFADANGMSVSEVVAEFMDAYASASVPPARERSTERVTIWVDPQRYIAFTRKVKKEGTTIAGALEAAMGDDA